MKVFNVNQNLRDLSEEDWFKIKEAVDKTHAKIIPDSISIKILVEFFIENVEPNFTVSCAKCKKRVINYWKRNASNWKTL